MHRHHSFLLIAALSLPIIGCAKQDQRLTVHPVTGKLLVNGKPAVRAEVSLRSSTGLKEPKGRSILPYGIVQSDGTFRIGTYTSDDGVSAGEYAVTIIWPKITIEGGEEIAGPDQFQGYYNDPQRPITKIVVKEGENQIPPLDLKMR